jgi:hypothetical protein
MCCEVRLSSRITTSAKPQPVARIRKRFWPILRNPCHGNVRTCAKANSLAALDPMYAMDEGEKTGGRVTLPERISRAARHAAPPSIRAEALNNLAGVHDQVGVDRLLEGAHEA